MRFPRTRNRNLFGIVSVTVAVIALLVGATLISRRIFEEPARPVLYGGPTERGPIIQPSSSASVFQLAASTGTVEVYRGGRWVPITVGKTLSLLDVVRTGVGGSALLARPGFMDVELKEKVELRLDKVDTEGASLDLLRGKIDANVGAAGYKLNVVSGDTRATNEGAARFVVSAESDGSVQVAAKKGSVLFARGDKQVRVPEGTQSLAPVGQGPGAPQKIPVDVLLSVVWPGEQTAEGSVVVQGAVRPHTAVRINGARAEVGADGKFVASVPVRTGSNRVKVEAEELSGLTSTASSVVLRRSSRAPELETEPEELWKK